MNIVFEASVVTSFLAKEQLSYHDKNYRSQLKKLWCPVKYLWRDWKSNYADWPSVSHKIQNEQDALGVLTKWNVWDYYSEKLVERWKAKSTAIQRLDHVRDMIRETSFHFHAATQQKNQSHAGIFSTVMDALLFLMENYSARDPCTVVHSPIVTT